MMLFQKNKKSDKSALPLYNRMNKVLTGCEV